jgi:hypothetical protein
MKRYEFSGLIHEALRYAAYCTGCTSYIEDYKSEAMDLIIQRIMNERDRLAKLAGED